MSMWHSVEKSFVERLPPDIDGLVAYRLAFNPKQSSKDGRPWGTWGTSKRKGFGGKRAVHCNGGYKCENIKCLFLMLYNNNNRLQFEADEDRTKSVCSCCGVPATRVDCNAKKNCEFDEGEEYVTVYHLGDHNCEAKKTVELNKESLKQKFDSNSKTPPK
ncbi:Hypothetical predicted protein [Paramuricea clavata]|uniref:Uncharacterized protein n=1 Tax=Paramuricea clavata TaxID=317549 RepID=A0A7D9H8C6_PARCT|nr:Hypothetical predicted protein [Paramuricea clavata]